MARPSQSDFQETVRSALREVGRYTPALEIQVMTLASTLLTLATVTDDIRRLKASERWCGDTLKAHPAFAVQRYAWDSVTRQMKSLGLTAEGVSGEVEGDPLADLTRRLIGIEDEAPSGREDDT
ncbi:MAG: hypothetical protein NC342_08865 [Pseudoflavonifractor sp.]|nr:hypothetical protein [Alloprevotella sp.]MCM1117631.1 hypothetical protein [Pseudoflavonifractor sp.]